MESILDLSIVALLISLLAIFMKDVYRKKDARPWLLIKKFSIEQEGSDGLRDSKCIWWTSN